MKIQFNRLNASIKNNLNSLPLILIYGSNQIEIDSKCNEAVELICGPNAKEEMRVTKLTESSLLKAPENFHIKLKTVGFFPGKEVLIIEEATERLKKPLTDILINWSENDPTIILLAKTLKTTSSLRKLVEGHPHAICTGIYAAQYDTEKVNKILSSSTLKITDNKISEFLKNPNNFSSVNSLVSLIERLEIYKFSDPNPLTFDEIDLLLLDSNDPTIAETINFLANGDIENVMLLLKRLNNMGITPFQITNSIHKEFKLLHKVSLNLNNAEFVLNNTFPPVFGHRRQLVIKHSQIWATMRIERALGIIQNIEKQMRSSLKIELTSILERGCLKITNLIKSSN